MNRKILCVDDETHILEACKRQFRKSFEITTAIGGEEGLKTADEKGPFSVVISDLMMPGMDGIQFLSKMMELYPDSVRIILTGQADLDKAIEAVNEGNIFRFLTKPCSTERLAKVLDAGVEQYRLLTAEKELLEKTLGGSINVLMEVLSLVSPAAFGRAVRVQRIMRKLATALGLESKWEFDIAGMLSQIGCVTLPAHVLEKIYKSKSLSQEEMNMYQLHPDIGHNLLSNIPRLETIAETIKYQEKNYDGSGLPENGKAGDNIPLGARALHIALDFDIIISTGVSEQSALKKLHQHTGKYDPEILRKLISLCETEIHYEEKLIKLNELKPKMILAEDILSTTGLLLITKGQEATQSLIVRLQNVQNTTGVKEPISIINKG